MAKQLLKRPEEGQQWSRSRLSAQEVPGQNNPFGRHWQDEAAPSPRLKLLDMLSFLPPAAPYRQW